LLSLFGFVQLPLPKIFNALEVLDHNQRLVLEVAQHLELGDQLQAERFRDGLSAAARGSGEALPLARASSINR